MIASDDSSNGNHNSIAIWDAYWELENEMRETNIYNLVSGLERQTATDQLSKDMGIEPHILDLKIYDNLHVRLWIQTKNTRLLGTQRHKKCSPQGVFSSKL